MEKHYDDGDDGDSMMGWGSVDGWITQLEEENPF